MAAVPAPSASSLTTAEIDALADALFVAFESGDPIEPLTADRPNLRVDDAYEIQRHLVARHEAAGRAVRGRKIGLTSAAMRTQLGVDAPDFGVLLDSHTFPGGSEVSMRGLRAIAPRLEGEIGFVLSRPLAGGLPGSGDVVTAHDVRAATAQVLPVFELIDSRIRDWRIGLADTISDNASCLGGVLGAPVALADAGDLVTTPMVLSRDGEVLETGTGDAVMGDPAEAVAWLANELGRHGDALPAGEPILSGSLTAAVDATPGVYTADFGAGLGSVTIEIEE